MMNPESHEINHVTLLDLTNQVIAGRFKLLRRIRRGSYAEIWIAANLSPKAGEPLTVAVKVLNLGLQGQLESGLEAVLVENIKLEGQSLRRLDHTHIVRLYESGEDWDKCTGRQFYYLVLELLEGGDIYNLCHGAPLSLEDAMLYLAQTCSALTYAHAQGIIHRDIKPNNLLLTKDGSALKLLDFGTAWMQHRQNGVITRVGTAVYAAPESYSPISGMTLTPAADVYSVAKTLLFILTGDSPAYWAQKQITFLPRELGIEPSSQSLLAVLSKATCDQTGNRYQSVEEFHNALKQILELTELSSRPPQNRPRLRRQYDPPPKHTRFEIPVPNGGAGTAALPANTLAVDGFVDGVIDAIREAFINIPRLLAIKILLVIAIVAIVLGGLSQLLSLVRRPNPAVVSERKIAQLIGKEAQTITDVNIRSGPSAQQNGIGLAEKYSRVRILSYNNDRTWYEIEVIAHGRPKADPNAADRGWVRSKFVTLN